MFEVVSDVRQQRASRLQFGDVGQRLLDVQVRGVRLVAQRVDDQKIEAMQFLQRLVRNQVAIGDERGASASVAEAKACDFAFAVNDRDRRDSQPAGFELSFDHVRNELRQPSADVFALEDVREDAPQTPPRALARVNRNGAAPEMGRAKGVEGGEGIVGSGWWVVKRSNLLTDSLSLNCPLPTTHCPLSSYRLIETYCIFKSESRSSKNFSSPCVRLPLVFSRNITSILIDSFAAVISTWRRPVAGCSTSPR